MAVCLGKLLTRLKWHILRIQCRRGKWVDLGTWDVIIAGRTECSAFKIGLLF
jgi:hypothetical protein